MTLCCCHGFISTQTFPKALTASADSCGEIKSAPLMALPILLEFGGRCRKAMLGVWECPFNGITNSARVWRKVPESDARSVGVPL